MTHQQWQDLIPFYVAQTLPPEQARAFEQYTAQCGIRCQREIEAWRSIAAAVWLETDASARPLPALSPEFYQRLSQRSTPVPSYSAESAPTSYVAPPAAAPRPRRERGGVPVTLVAGILVALVFGALLLGIGLRPGDEAADETELALNSSPAASDEQAGAAAIEVVDGSETPPLTPTPLASSTTVPGSGILPTPITEQPSAVPSSTPIPPGSEAALPQASSLPPPTTTPLPPTSVPLEQPENMRQDAAPLGGGPYITMTPGLMESGYHQCFLFNPLDTPISAYQAAGGGRVVGTVGPGEQYRTLIRSETGWYQIFLSGAGSAWVPPQNAYLTGNCAASLFWVPTPTLLPATRTPVPSATPTEQAILPIGPGNIAIVQVPTAFLYAEPNVQSDIIATVQQDERLVPIAATFTDGTQWTQVRYSDLAGWIITTQIVTYAEEDAPPETTDEP